MGTVKWKKKFDEQRVLNQQYTFIMFENVTSIGTSFGKLGKFGNYCRSFALTLANEKTKQRIGRNFRKTQGFNGTRTKITLT